MGTLRANGNPSTRSHEPKGYLGGNPVPRKSTGPLAQVALLVPPRGPLGASRAKYQYGAYRGLTVRRPSTGTRYHGSPRRSPRAYPGVPRYNRLPGLALVPRVTGSPGDGLETKGPLGSLPGCLLGTGSRGTSPWDLKGYPRGTRRPEAKRSTQGAYRR